MLTVRRAPRTRVRVPAMLGGLESVAALALAHVVAGGEVPTPWWLAAFGLLVYAAGGLVLRGRAGIRVVLPVLLGLQVLGHAWLVALTPTTHGAHAHADGVLLGLTPAMLAAHLVAAIVTGAMWVLRRRVLDVVLRWSASGSLPVPDLRVARALARVGHPVVLRHVLVAPTRGPPVGALATA